MERGTGSLIRIRIRALCLLSHSLLRAERRALAQTHVALFALRARRPAATATSPAPSTPESSPTPPSRRGFQVVNAGTSPPATQGAMPTGRTSARNCLANELLSTGQPSRGRCNFPRKRHRSASLQLPASRHPVSSPHLRCDHLIDRNVLACRGRAPPASLRNADSTPLVRRPLPPSKANVILRDADQAALVAGQPSGLANNIKTRLTAATAVPLRGTATLTGTRPLSMRRISPQLANSVLSRSHALSDAAPPGAPPA